MTFYRYTSKEIDDLEEMGILWVCIHCDYHCSADSVSDRCPKCGEEIEDDE